MRARKLQRSHVPVVKQYWFFLSRFSTTTYYKYFVSSYSKELRVKLNHFCPTNNCSLKLFLSASSLPKHSSLNCTSPCVLNISWPQPRSYYYIEVSGTSSSYKIRANHIGRSYKEILTRTAHSRERGSRAFKKSQTGKRREL